MTIEWHDLLGTFGVLLILAVYLLLQMQRLSATGWLYSALNGVGASLVIVSLTQEFNFPALVLEVAWLLISLYGLKAWWNRRKPAPPTLEG
jgi:hypothetical protein